MQANLKQLYTKKQQLENKIAKLERETTRCAKTDIPGTFITGNSGVSRARRRKLNRQLDATIDRAKAYCQSVDELRAVEAKISWIENKPKRDNAEKKADDILHKMLESITVGQMIDVGGNDLLKVVKVNKKTVLTEGGTKWTANEIMWTKTQIANFLKNLD